MTILNRYILRGHLYFMFLCLGLGSGLYLLADLFERLDNFTNAEIGAWRVLFYFLVKLPMIISQIMPAVFLIATVVQLSLMSRAREILALQVCGVSFKKLLVFIFWYGLLWSVLQLAFSQLIGIPGEQTSGRIWKEEVQNREYDRSTIFNIWFKEGNYVVNLDYIKPAEQTGHGVLVYQLGDDKLTLEKTYSAESVTAKNREWIFSNVKVFSPQDFTQESLETMSMPALAMDLRSFAAVDSEAEPAQLSLWQLSNVIAQLESSGSNVEALWTIWHMKLAYAASMLVMGLIALAISTLGLTLYVNVPLAFIVTFIYYGLFMFGVSAAERAAVSPIVGTWSANILFIFLSLFRLFCYLRPDMTAKIFALFNYRRRIAQKA